MTKPFGENLKKIVEVVMFENWLRFYFIAEADNKDLMILIPEQGIGKMEKDYPHLVGLAKKLNQQLITHEKSMREVCLFVADTIDGVSAPESLIQRILSSREFQLELQIFSSWVQSHEGQLDKSFMEFSQWMKIYTEWKETDKIKEHIEKMKQTLKTPVVPGSESIQ